MNLRKDNLCRIQLHYLQYYVAVVSRMGGLGPALFERSHNDVIMAIC